MEKPGDAPLLAPHPAPVTCISHLLEASRLGHRHLSQSARPCHRVTAYSQKETGPLISPRQHGDGAGPPCGGQRRGWEGGPPGRAGSGRLLPERLLGDMRTGEMEGVREEE